MVYKKILAIILVFFLFLTNVKITAGHSNDFHANQTFGHSCSGVPWTVIITTGTALCLTSGCVGYWLGKINCFSKDRKNTDLDPNKEITLVGPTNEDTTVAPEGVNRFELLAIDYIDKLLHMSIPKLKISDEFSAQYLANVRSICYPVPHTLENIATKKGYHLVGGLALKLKNKRLILQQIVESEKKITVGYLISLLKEIKSLLEEAASIIEKNYYS